MEKKIRFRNHISVVLEQLGAASWVVFVLLLTNVDDVVEFFENGTSEEINMTALIVGAVLFGILVLACIYQLLLWSKTYISICDNSIVIERRRKILSVLKIFPMLIQNRIFLKCFWEPVR